MNAEPFDLAATCLIATCERPARSKRLCTMHYKRQWRHGDPLVRKKPTGLKGQLRRNSVRIENGIAYIDLSTERFPGCIARIDEGDLPLIIDGNGRWFPCTSKSAHGLFYAKRHRSMGRPELMHRLILGAPRGIGVDHVSGDGLDNRRSNLRRATQTENMRNSRGHAGSTSLYKGVSPDPDGGGWIAQIKYEGRQHRLGVFESEIKAAQVYDAAARQHFGEFARPNFDDEPAREAMA